jgi:adenylylsulfate kinase
MNGAGKTTLAKYLEARFRALGRPVEVLESPTFTALFGQGLGENKEDRNLLVNRLGFIAQAITASGGLAIVPALSPYREARDQIRRQIGKFIEVFVDCPVEELIKRDTTGRYKKALSGELPNFVGVTDPYEPPANPEVVVRTDLEPVGDSAQKIFQTMLNMGVLSGDDVKLLSGKKMAAQRVPKRRASANKPASIRTGLKVAAPKAVKPAAPAATKATPAAAKPAPAKAETAKKAAPAKTAPPPKKAAAADSSGHKTSPRPAAARTARLAKRR